MIKRCARTLSILFCLAATVLTFTIPASAQDDDPPSRVARLAYQQGSVSFQPGGTDDWVTAGLNRPLTTGDKLWSDRDGRVELQLGGSLVRLSANTGFSFLNLSDNVTQIQLTEGTLLIRVRQLDDNESYEVDTPNLAFSVLRPGLYRINVNEAGDSTAIKVRSGEGEVTGGGAAYTLRPNDSDTFMGMDQLNVEGRGFGDNQDAFDVWASLRDRHLDGSRSAQYVSTDIVGYDDLDDNGAWRQTPDDGYVWFPRTTVAGWAPYHYGHWAYIEPWGYTWVDDEPWGFAPFHYGRWVFYGGSWGWVPARPRAQGVVYVRPVYAPALVAWVGGPHFAIGVGVGGGYAADVNVGWFPLGPREVYVPSYRVSRNYVNNVNVSNTTVNTTVVNNYYNTTVVNNNVNVTNVKYVNQSVPGAVAATTPKAFTSAQPVARNAVKVDPKEVASAPVRAFTPPAAPAKQAVLGTGAPAVAKPPAAIQTRAVVAKVAPPPPPPTFEKRQEAIKNNGGKPLSVAQERQIAPVAAARPTPIRIAPAAKAVAPPAQPNAGSRAVTPAPSAPPAAAPNAARQPGRPGDRPPAPATSAPPAAAPNTARQPDRPADRPPAPANGNPSPARPVTPNAASRPPDRPAPGPVHPAELPAPPRTPVPPSANPALDKQHQQEQDQLRAKQEQDRQRLQQQQEQEHAKQPPQKPAPALEQQHQQQTQQLQQQHAAEQKQLQQKQQQERQAPAKQQPKKEDQPPDKKPPAERR